MNISWYGLSCFSIEEKFANATVNLITDPYEPEGGKKLSRVLAADIVTVSHDAPRHNNIAAVGGNPFLIDGPGEFEVKEVFVTGIDASPGGEGDAKKSHNTIYYITIQDVHMLHLGDLNHALSEKHIEDLHNIDVVFVPVGGGDVLNGKAAAELVQQIDPRIIIPMHYKSDGLGAGLDGIEPFLKAMGIAAPESVSKLKIAKKDLPQDEMKVYLLEPQ